MKLKKVAKQKTINANVDNAPETGNKATPEPKKEEKARKRQNQKGGC